MSYLELNDVVGCIDDGAVDGSVGGIVLRFQGHARHIDRRPDRHAAVAMLSTCMQVRV